MHSAIDHFEREAAQLTALYERAQFEEVHAQILPHLPPPGSSILDIGAGSGRDAAALVGRGYKVTAVEPTAALLAAAQARHKDRGIIWVRDSLPHLRSIRQDMFDFVLLSAVWMYVSAVDRDRSAATLAHITRPGGKIAMSLRELTEDEPGSFTRADLERTATTFATHGVESLARYDSEDTLGRKGKRWTTLILINGR